MTYLDSSAILFSNDTLKELYNKIQYNAHSALSSAKTESLEKVKNTKIKFYDKISLLAASSMTYDTVTQT